MRIGQYRTTETERPWCGARIDQDRIVHLPEAGTAAGITIPRRTSDLLGAWEWQRRARLAAEFAAETDTGVYRAEDVTAAPPVSDPQKVVCVGLNYEDHAEEGDNPIPEEPVLFSKFPTTIVGPDDAIAWDPEYTEKVDYEVELVAVIGERTRDVQPADALEAVAGYLVGNDVSARDLQHGDGQWVRGKSLDTFAPIGPELVTADEIDDPHDLGLWTEVNGERVQESTTSNLIFGVDELVSFCSRAFTLLPGDLLFTGTPPGVGVYRDPPILLEDGDTVEVGIEEIGTLANRCEHRQP